MHSALKKQYHAGLWMLRDVIVACPDEIWLSGAHPRSFWRIAYHVIFYTHLYLQPRLEAFQPWERHREGCTQLWEDANPPVEAPYSKEELLAYLDSVDRNVDQDVERLDLESQDCGIPWYKMSKLEHQFVNIRHIAIHTGQLSEILFERGIDTNWKGSALSAQD